MKKTKTLSYLDREVLPRIAKFSNNKLLRTIRDGILSIIPFVIVGSIPLIILNFPVGDWPDKSYDTTFGSAFGKITDFTFNQLSVIAVIGIAYHFAINHKTDPLMTVLISLLSFFMILWGGNGDAATLINIDKFDASGMFMGIISTIFAGYMMFLFQKYKIEIKLPSTVPPAVAKAFSAILPTLFIFVFWFLVRVLPDFDIADKISEYLQKPITFAINTPYGMGTLMFLVVLLWFFGLHGDAILYVPVAEAPTLALLNQNVNWTKAHPGASSTHAPNIFAYGFVELFVNIGGTGAAIGLVVALLIQKNKDKKALGIFSAVPSIFNISEPIVFGVPIVLNLYILIPLLIMPPLLVTVTWLLMFIHLIGRPIVSVPWTTPPIVGAYLATLEWKAAIWSAIEVVITALLYIPFVTAFAKADDNEAADTDEIKTSENKKVVTSKK